MVINSFKLFCFFLLICGGPVLLSAQQYVDLAKFTYATTPANQFDSSDVSTSINEFIADITLPVVLSEKTALITGFTFESLNAKLAPELPNNQTVYTTLIKLGLNISHGEKWNTTWMLMPKLSSDLQLITERDFQLGGSLLVKYKKRNSLVYQFGMYYNNELSGPFLVPLLGLYYKSNNEKFEINATLPVWAEMNYAVNTWFTLGVNFLAFVKTFHFSEPLLSEKGLYWSKSTNELFAYTQFNIKKNYIFQLKGGYSIGRNYGVYEDDDKVDLAFSAFKFGDNRNLENRYFANGVIFQARFFYRFFL
jgi:hypothetical protein